MRPAVFVFFAALGVVSVNGAQPQVQRVDPDWVREDRDRHVVHTVPGMDAVVVRRDLAYKRADSGELLMDVYLPPGGGAGGPRPVVVLVHGGYLPPNLLTQPKEWGQYRSLGRLVAASGLVAATFNHRFYSSMNSLPDSASDLLDAVAYLRGHAASFGIDPERVALWTFSGAGVLLTDALRASPPHVRALVAYYALLDLEGIERVRPGAVAASVRQAFSPARALARPEGAALPPPLLVVRAGRDRAEVNGPMGEFLRAALAANADIELLTHPTGRHGFDILDDDERSRLAIERTVAFLRERTR